MLSESEKIILTKMLCLSKELTDYHKCRFTNASVEGKIIKLKPFNDDAIF